jgi:sugar phosphate isomerase/epimerase
MGFFSGDTNMAKNVHNEEFARFAAELNALCKEFGQTIELDQDGHPMITDYCNHATTIEELILDGVIGEIQT